MNSRFYWLIVVLILGSIAMGACTAPKPTETGPGGFPIGIYKPDKVHDIRSLYFNAQGMFVTAFADEDTGSYVVNGDQITFNMDIGICHNHPGTYHWEIHGNTLTLKPINETCTESSRAADMGGRSWIRQP